MPELVNVNELPRISRTLSRSIFTEYFRSGGTPKISSWLMRNVRPRYVFSVQETKVIDNRSLPSHQDVFLLFCYHLPLCTHCVQATESLFLHSDSLNLFLCKGLCTCWWFCRGRSIPISSHNGLFSIQVSTNMSL